MSKSYVFEGKTSTEAIEKGLKELKVKKNDVDIKIIEEEKRTFFSILDRRTVKVELTIKEGVTPGKAEEKEVVKENKVKEVKEISSEDKEKVKSNVEEFVKDFISKLPENNFKYEISEEDGVIKVSLDGDNIGYLIGYRGEVLNSLQTILTNVASKNIKDKARVVIDISNYRGKREKDLIVLADKIAHTVVKQKKSITLEPMSAYERKIIHTRLQKNDKVKTYSIGEEPHRKVVVALK